MRTFFFYAQSPDFHKQGLCYYLKILGQRNNLRDFIFKHII